jgi:hypothetical protein
VTGDEIATKLKHHSLRDPTSGRHVIADDVAR